MDLAAQCASLANDYGATHGPNSPASFTLALFIGDPNGTGYEVTTTTVLVDEDTGAESTVSNGYARPTVANNGTNFPAADPATGILSTPIFTFPVSLAEYPEAVTHWQLYAGSVAWDSGEFSRDQRITVDAAGVTPRCSLAIFYNPITNLSGV